MANDPTQDKDFLAASPADQHAYLMSTDPDYAKAAPADQKAYLTHITQPSEAQFGAQMAAKSLGQARGYFPKAGDELPPAVMPNVGQPRFPVPASANRSTEDNGDVSNALGFLSRKLAAKSEDQQNQALRTGQSGGQLADLGSRTARVAAGLTSPQAIATGAAVVGAPLIAAPALIGHGLWGAGGSALDMTSRGVNPENAEGLLGGLAETAGGVAGGGSRLRYTVGDAIRPVGGGEPLTPSKLVMKGVGKLFPESPQVTAGRQFEDLLGRQGDIEQARQKELGDNAKLSQQYDTENAQRLSDVEAARQKELVANERLKEQDAQARMRRGREQGMLDRKAPTPESNIYLPERYAFPEPMPSTARGIPQGAPSPFPEVPSHVIPVGGRIDPLPAESAGSAAQASEFDLQRLAKVGDKSAQMELTRRRLLPQGSPIDYSKFPLPRS